MSYTVRNFKTKKAMKEAVANGEQVETYQPNADMFGPAHHGTMNSTVYLEGPHFPEPHRWYANARTDANCCIIPGTIK